MKKKVPLVSRLLQAGSFAAMTLLSSGAEAKISPVAFNKITGYFKRGKEYLSPTIGEVALEAGLIYNFRFYSNAPKDPTGNLVKALFPSPAGHLTPTVGSDSNFGFHVKDPKTVALLLNYTNDLRDGKTDKTTKVRAFNEIIDSIRSEEDRDVEAKIQKAIVDFAESTKADFTELKSYKKNEQKKINSKTKELENKLLEQLKSLQLETVKFGDAEIKKVIKALKTSPSVSAFNIFQNEILKGKLPAVNGVLEQIDKSIAQEKEGFYPNHTTEQILTSFLCEKFNAEDLVPFLRALNDEIVPNKQAIPDKIDPLTEEDLNEIAKKETYNLDDLFSNDIQGVFHSNIPFKSDQDPSSNGTTYFYNRDENRVVKAFDFQDCTETVLRQLVSMIVFNPLTKTYDISSLDEIKTPYIDNLRHYLITHPPAHANNGDISTRSDWNRVVGDLNSKDENVIQYLKERNEIKPGFVNSLRVLEKILGLTLPPFQEGTSKKDWIKTSFEKVLKALHPNRTYEIDVQNLKETGEEIIGKLNINVSEKGKKLFSFSLNQSLSHAYISNVLDEGQEQAKKTSPFSNKKLKRIETSDTAESSWLLASTNLQFNKITLPIYRLFPTPLQDNYSRIKFLENLTKLSKEMESFINTHSIPFQTILTQVVKNIGWEDPEVRNKASGNIMRLVSKENFNFQYILFSGVKGISLRKNEVDLLNKFSHLEFLSINFPTKEINMSDLPKDLRTLNLTHVPSKTVALSQSQEKLENLTITSHVEEIQGLESLKNLNEFFLASSNCSTLTFSKSQEKLEKMTLEMPAFKNMEGFDFLKNLRAMRIVSGNLEKITFSESHEKLEELALYKSNIEGLNFLKNLRKLDWQSVQFPESLVFSQSHEKLEEVNLRKSHINNIEGLQFLKNLRTLNLRDTKGFTNLTLPDSLEKLEDVLLADSAIEELYIPNLPKGGTLAVNVFDAKELKKLELKRGIKLTGMKEDDARIKWLD